VLLPSVHDLRFPLATFAFPPAAPLRCCSAGSRQRVMRLYALPPPLLFYCPLLYRLAPAHGTFWHLLAPPANLLGANWQVSDMWHVPQAMMRTAFIARRITRSGFGAQPAVAAAMPLAMPGSAIGRSSGDGRASGSSGPRRRCALGAAEKASQTRPLRFCVQPSEHPGCTTPSARYPLSRYSGRGLG